MSLPRLSLSHLSALELRPVELLSAAAAAGFWAVGLRLNPAAPGAISYPLRAGSAELSETRRRMNDTGVAIYDIEFVPLVPTIDVGSHERMLAAAAELGARRLNVSGDDPDRARLAARFAQMCELAGRYGLGVDLEFMRWRHVASLADAVEVVTRAGAQNGGILLDALHLFRSGGAVAEMRALEPGLIRSLQLCDAPLRAPPPEGIIEEARNRRLLPGRGELPLRALIESLPPGVAFAVEVPLPAGAVPAAHVAKLRSAAHALLQSVASSNAPGPPAPASAGCSGKEMSNENTI
jgi:sugar phosphate isomerase/epimerase